MPFTMPNWKSRIGLAVILLAFMAIALLIRLIPALFIKDSGFLYTLDTDTWFTLRQVEVMVNHFPQYDWFDPMTAFPTGKVIDWGPLFPFITAALCLITGATTHSAIIYVSSFVAPLMAALMVPVSLFPWKDHLGQENRHCCCRADICRISGLFQSYHLWPGYPSYRRTPFFFALFPRIPVRSHLGEMQYF